MPDLLKWQVGVTTVPARRGDLFPRTMRSLRAAGFTVDRIFADGATDAHMRDHIATHSVPCTVRWPKVGVYGNWLLGLWELYIRAPNAHRFALFQDDIVLSRNVRQYLEAVPCPDKAYINLFMFQENQALCPVDTSTTGFAQKVGFYPSNQLGRGAVALVFSREAVLTLLTHQPALSGPLFPGEPYQAHMETPTDNAETMRIVARKPMHETRGSHSVDGCVVTALGRAGWKEMVHNPSLVQHVGHKSTIGHDNIFAPAVSFRGEEFDCLDLLPALAGRGARA